MFSVQRTNASIHQQPSNRNAAMLRRLSDLTKTTTATIFFSLKWICSDLKSSTPTPCLTNISDLFSSFSSFFFRKFQSSRIPVHIPVHHILLFAPPEILRDLFSQLKLGILLKISRVYVPVFLAIFFFFLTLKRLSVAFTCFVNK